VSIFNGLLPLVGLPRRHRVRRPIAFAPPRSIAVFMTTPLYRPTEQRYRPALPIVYFISGSTPHRWCRATRAPTLLPVERRILSYPATICDSAGERRSAALAIFISIMPMPTGMLPRQTFPAHVT